MKITVLSIRNYRIRTRLIVFLFISSFLPIVFIASFLLFFIQDRLHNNLKLQMSISSEELRDKIDKNILEVFTEIKLLETNDNLLEKPSYIIGSFLERNSSNNKYYGTEKYYCISIITKENNKLLFQTRKYNINDNSIFSSITYNGEYNITKTHFIDEKIPVIDFIIPYRNKNNQITGIILATMDLRFLSEILEREKISGGISKDVIIYTEDYMLIARKESQKGYKKNALVEFPFLDKFKSYSSKPMIDYLANRQRVLAVSNSIIGLIPPLDNLKWNISIIQPLDDRSEETVTLIGKLRSGIFTVAFITIFTSLFFSIILLRSVIIPLKKLIDTTLKVEQGDFSVAIKDKGIDEFGQLSNFFNKMIRKIKELLDRLTKLATTDELTGLANRRTFNERLSSEMKRAKRYERNLTLGILDIDHFKKLNDNYGHEFGDIVLKNIADLIQQSVRETDFVARYGGEEIVIILTETSKKNSIAVLERVRTAIEQADFHNKKTDIIKVTVSIGIASYPDDISDMNGIFELADNALYKAKNSGRNRVEVAKELS